MIRFYRVSFIFLYVVGTWVSGDVLAEVSNLQQPSRLTEIPSPFVINETALLVDTTHSKGPASLRWRVKKTWSDEITTISFFHMEMTESPRLDSSSAMSLVVQGINTKINYLMKSIWVRNKLQFYFTEFVAEDDEFLVQLSIPQGKKVVLGHFGESIASNQLTTNHNYDGTFVRAGDIPLPSIYKGLNDFDLTIYMKERGNMSSIPSFIERVVVSLDMYVASGLLPRILPGSNEIQVDYSSAGPGSSLKVSILPEDETTISNYIISFDKKARSDGATFARVKVRAIDSMGRSVPGIFFRFVVPKEVKVYPYTIAISDLKKDHIESEFHVTSLFDGIHRLILETWTKHGWENTGEYIDIEFYSDEKTVKATKFYRDNYPALWLEPNDIVSHYPDIKPGESLFIGLSKSSEGFSKNINVISQTKPTVSWEIIGPVENLGVHASYQPDSRTISTIGESFSNFTYNIHEDKREKVKAYMIEEYANLLMVAHVQKPYFGEHYGRAGRIIRKGVGWCGPQANTVCAISATSGLKVRVQNNTNHIVCEVSGVNLGPTVLDANLEIRLSSKEGERLGHKAIDSTGKYFYGLGVDQKTRRGDDGFSSIKLYYDSTASHITDWKDADNFNWKYTPSDENIFSVSLAPWERITWNSGMLSVLDYPVLQESILEQNTGQKSNQNKLRMVAEIGAGNIHNPGIVMDNAVVNRNVLINSGGTLSIKFRMKAPIEVDGGLISVEGSTASNSYIGMMWAPHIEYPILTSSIPYELN